MCPGCMWDMSRYMWDICGICLGYMQDMSRIYVGYVGDTWPLLLCLTLSLNLNVTRSFHHVPCHVQQPWNVLLPWPEGKG